MRIHLMLKVALKSPKPSIRISNARRKEVRHLSKKIDEEKIMKESAEYWYNKCNVSLSPEDVREAHNNLTGFFQVLSEWDQRSRA